MQIYEGGEQVSMFDAVSDYSKTSTGSCPPTTEKTSGSCSNHWQGSRKTGFMFLNLRNMSGGGGWSNAGTIIGDAFSIAWRVTDAQYYGVPQRRKRIAVLADFNGLLAPEILFECNSGGQPGSEVRSVPEGLSRNSEESGSEGEDREDAGDSGEGSGISSGSYTFRNHFDGRIVRENSLCLDTCGGGDKVLSQFRATASTAPILPDATARDSIRRMLCTH